MPKGTLVLLGGGCQITVLEHCLELTFAHTAATLDVERFYRRDDPGSAGGLLQGEQNRFGGDRALQRSRSYRDHLHRDCSVFLGRIVGAAWQEN